MISILSLSRLIDRLLTRVAHQIRRARLAANPGPRTHHSRSHVRRSTLDRSEELVILTSNLWHDWPRHRRLHDRLESFAGLVERESAEIVLLQEVFRKPDLAVDDWLARRLGMEYVYTRANGHDTAIGFEEGLAVFSRFPIAETRFQRLTGPDSRFVNRWALAARLATPLGDIWGVSVHLSVRQSRNRDQLHGLRSWVDSLAGDHPAAIGGDFNAPEFSPQIRKASGWWTDTFRAINPEADGTTYVLLGPGGIHLRRSRLDYLFLRSGLSPWQVDGAAHVLPVGLPHSDHRAVIARASLGQPG